MIKYGPHQIDESDIAAVTAVLRGKQLTSGPEVEKFEAALALQIEAKGVCVVSSGTAALHLAYAALGLEPGDEIITSPLTFVATANAARMLGAEVRFADIDPTTGNLDPKSVRRLLSSRTRGIVPVHFGGLPADLEALCEIAEKQGLWLVDDAAHALGANYKNTPIGGQLLSDATTFSFHPVKQITTAEGGAIAVQDLQLLAKLKRLREHGLARNFEPDCGGHLGYEQHELGYNYRLSDVQCALGRSQLAKLPRWVKRRQQLASLYREALKDIAGIALQATTPHAQSSYHLLVALLDFDALGISKPELRRRLASQGIAPQVHDVPVCGRPYYQLRYGDADCPHAREVYRAELSLPLHAGMTEEHVWQVVTVLKNTLMTPTPRSAPLKAQLCRI